VIDAGAIRDRQQRLVKPPGGPPRSGRRRGSLRLRALLYRAVADEAGGRIEIRQSKADGTVVGASLYVKPAGAIAAGDYVLLLEDAAGELAALRCEPAKNGKYCVVVQSADEPPEDTAVRLDPMQLEGQFGIVALDAENEECALRSPTDEVCEPQPLGLGFEWEVYPTPYRLDGGFEGTPFNVTIANPSVVHGPAPDAFIRQWTEGVAGLGYDPPGVPSPIFFDGTLVGAHAVEGWVDERGADCLPFKAMLPHHTTGTGVGTAAAVEIADAPTDGVWLHSQPFPIVGDRRVMNGPGPLHDSSLRWDGAEASMRLPFDIRTEGQVFVNLQATLAHDEEAGKLRLTLRVWVVVLLGKQADFQFSVPVTITTTGINCPDPGTLEGTTGTCGAAKRDKDLSSLGCYCVWKPPTESCEGYEVSFCNLCRTNCDNPPDYDDYPSCDPGHKRFLYEVATWGHTSRVVEADWEADAEYTEANMRTAFAIPAGDSLAKWVADEFDLVESFTITTGEGVQGLSGVITATAGISGVNWQTPESLDGPGDIQVLGGRECLPQITAVQLTDVSGYLGQLRQEHLGIIDRAYDAYSCGINPSAKNLLARMGVPNMGEDGAAYEYICRLWRSWELAHQHLVDGTPGIIEASRYGPLVPATDRWPNGFDATNGEWVFCPANRPTVADLLGKLHNQDPNEDCSDIALFTSADRPLWVEVPGQMIILPPTWRGLNPGTFCGSQHWTLVGQGGPTYDCGYKYKSDWCDFYPDDPICDPTPGSPDDACLMISDPWWPHSVRMPRTWILEPSVDVRVKKEGAHLLFRAHYVTSVIREETCWLGGVVEQPWATEGRGPPMVVSLGKIEVGRGAHFTAPIEICNVCEPEVSLGGGVLPPWLYMRPQAIATKLCGCEPADSPRVQVCGRGNSLAIFP